MILQATFLWQNDKPGGLGFTFGQPGFTPGFLAHAFTGESIKTFMRDSDGALGSNVAADYLAQLETMGQMKTQR